MNPRKIGWCALLVAVASTSLSVIAWGQTTGGPYQFFTVTPCRLVDTRLTMGATQLVGSTTQNITVKGACGVPASAKVAVINLVGLTPTLSGNLNAWATGTTFPQTTVLTINAGETALANGAIVRLGTGTPDLSVVYGTASGMGTCHLIVDVVGYFQ